MKNMARPKKCRHIRCSPAADYFKPRGIPMTELEEIILEHDELEALRLADLEGLSHENSASRMKISRATFGRIIESARKKIADGILNGKAIKISQKVQIYISRGKDMKIAVATNDGIHVTGHVGRCKAFIIFETNENGITSKKVVENTFTHHAQGHHHDHEHDHDHGHGHQHGGGHGHSGLIDALGDCSHLIFQSAGPGLIANLVENNITPVATMEKEAETAVSKLLKGELEIEEDPSCGHHH